MEGNGMQPNASEFRNSQNQKVQKLEQVMEKGEAFISFLGDKGVDTGSVRRKMDEAKAHFNANHMSKAYELTQGCIGDLMKLKDIHETSKTFSKGNGIHSLIQDSTAETDREVARYKERMDSWRKEGFKLVDEETFFFKSFDDVEKGFISLEEKIRKADEIRNRIKGLLSDFSIIGNAYKRKLKKVEKAALRLEMIDDCDKRIDGIESTFKSVEGRFKAFNNSLNRYRSKGLATSSLEEMLDNDEDMDYLEKQFNVYEANLEHLIKEKQKLNGFKKDLLVLDFNSQIGKIERIIDNPWKLDDIAEMMLRLEKEISRSKEKNKLKEEHNRREKIKNSLDRYGKEGFEVKVVEQLLNEDINILEEEYNNFTRGIAKLKPLREKLFTFDASGFQEEISRISESMTDPANIEHIEKEMNALNNKITERRSQMRMINSAISKWSGKGFLTSKLEEALKTDVSGAVDMVAEYKEKITQLMKIERKLEKIKYEERDDQIRRILLNIKNPEMLESVKREFSLFERKVKELEKIKTKRKELNALLKVWKEQGYKVDAILHAVSKDDTSEELELIILDYTKAIATLEPLKPEFEGDQRGWFPKEEEFIRSNMDDPNMAQDVVRSFRKLRSMNSMEEKRRGQIERKIKELSKKGIETSEIESLLHSDRKTLMTTYGEYLPKVKTLLRLKASLLKEGLARKDPRLEDFARKMNDPNRIKEYQKETERFRSSIPE